MSQNDGLSSAQRIDKEKWKGKSEANREEERVETITKTKLKKWSKVYFHCVAGSERNVNSISLKV